MNIGRVYSSLLLAVFVTDNGFARQDVVPDGHRWVFRHIVWAPAESVVYDTLTFKIHIDVETADTDGTVRVFPLIQGAVLAYTRPEEWEGRLVVPAGSTIRTFNATEPANGTHPMVAYMTGYDLLG